MVRLCVSDGAPADIGGLLKFLGCWACPKSSTPSCKPAGLNLLGIWIVCTPIYKDKRDQQLPRNRAAKEAHREVIRV